MRLGYNTNGFAHHSLDDAVAILREIGYQSIALTLERDVLATPERSCVTMAVRRINGAFKGHELSLTIETGARFILDPWRKHQPTLISPLAAERAKRTEFLLASIDIAMECGAESVSLWSGAPEHPGSESADTLMERLIHELEIVCDHAATRGVRLSFEPEPGMLVEMMDQFEAIQQALGSAALGLTLDVGHVHCLDDGDLASHIQRYRHLLWNLHVEDMRRGRHEHLMFGEGEMNFPRIFKSLHEVDYTGPVHVELSRHSHDAVRTAQRAYEFLAPLITAVK